MRYFSGAADEYEADVTYWQDWGDAWHMREMAELVDVSTPWALPVAAIAMTSACPSANLSIWTTVSTEGVPPTASGFRNRNSRLGTLQLTCPAKGIHDLIRALGSSPAVPPAQDLGMPAWSGNGRVAASLPAEIANKIEWMPEYRIRISFAMFLIAWMRLLLSVWVENCRWSMRLALAYR
ncbi:hypothetical protein [Paludibacterium denitrificans]|nr:hypothetical protein [Paludibacterium denitrificans]